MRPLLLAGYTRHGIRALSAEETSAELVGQNPGYVVVVLALWLLAGLVTAAVMAQRGHSVRPLLALGVVMGPLMIPYARVLVRAWEGGGFLEIGPSPPLTSGRNVVVLLLGRVEQSADLLGLLRQLEASNLRLTLAVPAPLQATEPEPGDIEPWFQRLIDGAVLFNEFNPRLVALRGRIDRTLAELIQREAIDIVFLTRRCRRLPPTKSDLPGPVYLTLDRPG